MQESLHLRRDIDKIEKVHPATQGHSSHQPCAKNIARTLNFNRSVNCPNEVTTASARGLFDYDLNTRTRNNGAKLTKKNVNRSVAQHFFPIR